MADDLTDAIVSTTAASPPYSPQPPAPSGPPVPALLGTSYREGGGTDTLMGAPRAQPTIGEHDFGLNPEGKPVILPAGPPPALAPGHVQLSNGRFIIAPGTTPQQQEILRAQVEDYLDQYGLAQAKAQGKPYYTPGKTYSASHIYGPSLVEQGMAELDHAGPGEGIGNWLNRNVADPVNQTHILPQWAVSNPPTIGSLGESGMRILTNRAGWLYDLPASGFNVAKHLVQPKELGNYGDLPLIGETVRGAINAPELSADAPWWQQAIEAGLSGLRSGRSGGALMRGASGLASSLVSGAAGVGGSYLGEKAAEGMFGERGRELGSFLGGFGGGALPKTIKDRGLAAMMRSGERDAQGRPISTNVYEAGSALARDQAAREIAATRGAAAAALTPAELESAVQAAMRNSPGRGNAASTISMANPTAARFLSWFKGAPYAGKDLRADAERPKAALQEARDATATNLAGRFGIPPEGGTPENIGSLAIEGSQRAVPRMMRARDLPYENLMGAVGGPGVEVTTRPIERGLRDRTFGNQMPPHQEDTYRGIVERNITDATLRPPQSGVGPPRPGPAFDTRPGARPNAQAQTAPWGLLQGVLSGQTAELGEGALTAGRRVPAFIKNDIQDALRLAANHYGGPGGAEAFDAARQNYRQLQRQLRRQYTISGEPVAMDEHGRPVFAEEKTPGEAQAADRILTGAPRMSPNKLGPFERLEPDYRGGIAGRVVSSWGNMGGPLGGNFRPEKLASDIRSYSPATRATMFMTEPTPVPGALSSTERMDHAATLGGNYSGVVPERTGLQSTASTSLAAEGGTQAIKTEFERAFGERAHAIASAATAGLLRTVTGGFVTPEFKNAMGRQPIGPDYWRQIQRILPIASAVAEERKPAFDYARVNPDGTITQIPR